MDPKTQATADADEDLVASEYLTFTLGSEEYAIDILKVQEIRGYEAPTLIANAPPFIKGVINLRGKVIPLMDVRLRFGMPERAYDERTVVIVMDVGEAPIGLIVDGVSEVLEIPPSQVDRHTQFGRSAARPVIAGIGRIGVRVAVLLDTAVLVADGDIALPADVAA